MLSLSFLMTRRPPTATLFPYTTLFRSSTWRGGAGCASCSPSSAARGKGCPCSRSSWCCTTTFVACGGGGEPGCDGQSRGRARRDRGGQRRRGGDRKSVV